LTRKGLSVWVFSSLTFIAMLHLLDAISALFFGNSAKLLQFYPFVGEKLQTIGPSAYFWITIVAALVLWGITCGIAFENPVETFLNKILSDAKAHSAVETQLLEGKSEVLDAMFETIEASSETLSQVKDLIYNVRTEAREIQPLKESIDSIKTDMGSLRREFRTIQDSVISSKICRACGKPLMPEFNLCPYCGESIRPLEPPMITIKGYR